MKGENSGGPSGTGGVVSERHDLLQGRGQGGGHGGVAANGAGAVELQPGVKAAEVKVVAALGHHPQHLGVLVVAEADGARGVVASVAHVRELGVGVYDRVVEAGDAVVLERVAVVGLGDEDDAGEDDGVVVVGGGVGDAAVAEGAAAEVGGEDKGGEEEEDAEGDGDGVAEAEGGDVGGGGGWRGEGVEGGH
ncbi:hypothetical protein Fmac_010534 [Flemingia macrophylla]|uniref:Uncharacterized protein n=1 Tax=Flemingia macrophylla TaxID=520843 RepID=A0ABD1MJU6_9FABA